MGAGLAALAPLLLIPALSDGWQLDDHFHVRSDCELTRRATGHKEWPASALLTPSGAVSD